MKKVLTRKNGIVAALAVSLLSIATIYLLNRAPAKEPIPMGFTLLGIPADGKGEVAASIVEDPTKDLRLIYTTSMLVVENKKTAGDPMMIGGGNWYYRQPVGNAFKVVVISGSTQVTEFDNIMIITNAETCLEGPCTSGTVRMLNTNLETFLAETSAHQYIVVNP